MRDCTKAAHHLSSQIKNSQNEIGKSIELEIFFSSSHWFAMLPMKVPRLKFIRCVWSSLCSQDRKQRELDSTANLGIILTFRVASLYCWSSNLSFKALHSVSLLFNSSWVCCSSPCARCSHWRTCFTASSLSWISLCNAALLSLDKLNCCSEICAERLDDFLSKTGAAPQHWMPGKAFKRP